MGKCILLSRVSTAHQTLEQQTDELIRAAKNLGYEDYIVIEDKESAIKLSEEERHGLQELKSHILDDPEIKCVVAYEVSRISRKAKILYSIRDFLFSHNIQLIILKPYMELLDSDGKISQTANMVFALFTSMAETEMSLKKERMIRGKHKKMEDNKWVGGFVSFGYKVDENKNIVIDYEKIATVHKIFDLYESGKSGKWIAEELLSTGELDMKLDNAIIFVRQTLNRIQYTGRKGNVGYNYPQIISEEQYDKCRKIAKDKKKEHSNTKMIYYAKRLLYSNGRALTPCMASRVYSSNNYTLDYHITINLNIIDSFAWYITKKYIKENYMEYNKDDIKEIQEELHILNLKFEKAAKDIKQMKSKINKIEERIINGRLDDSKGDKMEDEIKSQIKQKTTEMKYIDHQIAMKDVQLQSNSNIKENIDNVDDDSERSKLIRRTILRMELNKMTRGKYELLVMFENNTTEKFYIVSCGKHREVMDKDMNEIDYGYMERCIRKKYS